MMQISQRDVERTVELSFGDNATLRVSNLEALREFSHAGRLDPAQFRMMEQTIHECSGAIFLTVMTALEASGNSMDCGCVARGLSKHDARTLTRLVDLLEVADPVGAAQLKAEILAGAAQRLNAESKLADLIMQSAGDFDQLCEIAKVLVGDPKNVHLHRFLFTALDHLSQLRRLSANLLIDLVREEQLDGTSSYIDAIALGVRRDTNAGAHETAHRRKILEDELIIKAAAAAAQAIIHTPIEEQIKQLKDRIAKMKDAIQKDYALGANGPVEDRYSHVVAWNQEMAQEDRDETKLRDLEAQEPARLA